METNNNDKIKISCSWPVPLIVFLAFFFAKIYDKIDWSWWWVLSPLWIPIVIAVILIIVILILKMWIEW